jgi:beta-lactamase regulating signal transducer with metallopeptidase domain
MTIDIEMLTNVRDAWAMGMVRACWQGGLAIFVAWVICRCWARLSPTIRSWIWRLAFVKLLASLLWWSPVEIPVLRPQAAPVLKNIADTPLGLPASKPTQVTRLTHGKFLGLHEVVEPNSDYFAWLVFCAWLAGVLAAMAWLAAQWRIARHLVGRSIPIQDVHAHRILEDLCARLSFRRSLRLLTSDEISGPAVWGRLCPAIVLPGALVHVFEPARMQMLLAHELMHAKRHDLQWNWLRAVANVVFWFHPLVWVANRHWHLAQESACDEGALAITNSSIAQYGEFLLDVVHHASLQARFLSVGIGAGTSFQTLQKRISAMQAIQPLTRRRIIIAGTVFFVVGMISLIPWRLVTLRTVAAEPQKPDAAGDGENEREFTIGPKTATPLDQAVREFSEKTARHSFNLQGPRQSPLPKEKWPAPLTADEVIAAIRGWDRTKHPVADSTYRIYEEIAKTKILPPHSQLSFQDQWWQYSEQDNDEYRVWWIDLAVMTGKNAGYGLRIRDQKLDQRIVLRASPGYHWVWGPDEVQVQPGHQSAKWNHRIGVSIGEDNTGALVVHVGRSRALQKVRGVAFDNQGKRYEMRTRELGLNDDFAMEWFRLDPAELPCSKVQYFGVEGEEVAGQDLRENPRERGAAGKN